MASLDFLDVCTVQCSFIQQTINPEKVKNGLKQHLTILLPVVNKDDNILILKSD